MTIMHFLNGIVAVFLISLVLLIATEDALSAPVAPKVIDQACERYDFKDCDLVKAIAWTENRFRHETVMDEGSLSYGMMQVKCGTARMVGLKHSCEQLRESTLVNLRFAIRYLKHQKERYSGYLLDVIASYNAGSAIVCKNYNPGKCFPGEYINHQYVYQVWRKYQWLKRERQKTQGPFLDHFSVTGISEKQATQSKLVFQTSLDALSR